MVDNITYCMDQFYCYGTPGRNMNHTVDLQLPMQSVPITSNPAHGEVYSIQHYMTKFVSDLWQVGGFLRELRFSPPIKLI